MRDRAPLTLSQERIWFLSQLDPESPYYNYSCGLVLRGTLRADCLSGALTDLIARHPALRTRFPELDGFPVQEVMPPGRIELASADFISLTDVARRRRLHEVAQHEARAPFDLSSGSLLRPRLLRLGP